MSSNLLARFRWRCPMLSNVHTLVELRTYLRQTGFAHRVLQCVPHQRTLVGYGLALHAALACVAHALMGCTLRRLRHQLDARSLRCFREHALWLGEAGIETETLQKHLERARYYASSMGRWMSPDWSAKEQPVPYAKLGDPQTLNLYSYVQNNPLSRFDDDGHETQTYDLPGLNRTAAQNAPMSRTEMKIWAGLGLTAAMASGAGELAIIGRSLLGLGMLAASNPQTVAHVADALAPPGTPSFSVWSMAPMARGMAVEAQLGANLPANFPTIDRFANGVATSIKSLDLNASSYQNAGTLASTVTGYIDKLASFNGASLSGATVSAAQITGRQLELAVPAGASAAQQGVLNSASQYANSVGVQLTIKQVK